MRKFRTSIENVRRVSAVGGGAKFTLLLRRKLLPDRFKLRLASAGGLLPMSFRFEVLVLPVAIVFPSASVADVPRRYAAGRAPTLVPARAGPPRDREPAGTRGTRGT